MEPIALTFLYPWWLLLLFPAVGLWWRLWRNGNERSSWKRVVDPHLQPHLLTRTGTGWSRLRLTGLLLALLLAIVALAGPATSRPVAGFIPSACYVVVVDLSTGMARREREGPGIERLKSKLIALLRRLPAGQSALIVYGAEPYLVAPPTTDIDTLIRFVPEFSTAIIPSPGDRPDRALSMAAAVLERSGAEQREIIWMTASTGASLQGGATQREGRLSILHTSSSIPASVTDLAIQRGGIALPIVPGSGDIEQLLDAMPSSTTYQRSDSSPGHAITPFGYWLLLPVVAIVIGLFRRGVVPLLVAAVFTLPTPSPVKAEGLSLLDEWQLWRSLHQEGGVEEVLVSRVTAKRWRAVIAYRAGHYTEAERLFAEGDDADARYNLGNTLVRQGRLADALIVFNQAVVMAPADEDIRHNRDLVRQWLAGESDGEGERTPPPPGPGGGDRDADQRPERDRLSGGARAEQEASRIAEQWLNSTPDRPGELLARKLQAEQRRRQRAGQESETAGEYR